MDHFQLQGGVMFAEDVPLSRIAEAVGTPFYCYSRATLERHWHAFDQAAGDVPHLICYAVKANGNLAILNLLARLAAYPWPGNLRQLANVLRTACAMLAEGEDTLGWEHMPDDLVQALTALPTSPRSDAVAAAGVDGLPASLSLQQLSQAAIDQAL